MVPDLSRTTSSQASGPGVPTVRCKYRIRFRKGGDLRLVSHHDLMHCVERMLRRADLPMAQTQGFHPQPRMAFASALALGMLGSNEVLELELTQPLDADELHARLACQAPPGLDILSVRRLLGKTAAQVRRAFYRLPLPDPLPNDIGETPLATRCAELVAQPRLWIQRSRPQPRKIDLHPYLSEVSVTPSVPTTFLQLALWVTPSGTARPEEIAHFLGLDQVLADGAFFERTDLELADEVSADAPPPPSAITIRETTTEEETGPDRSVPPAEPASAARPTALISGPLSFDS